MTIQVTQCENCPFRALSAKTANLFYCGMLRETKQIYEAKPVLPNCPLLTSDSTVTLKL